jgi:hypothetical protein
VEGFVADDPDKDSDEWEEMTWLACSQMHFVNPRNGKVLGSDDE